MDSLTQEEKDALHALLPGLYGWYEGVALAPNATGDAQSMVLVDHAPVHLTFLNFRIWIEGQDVLDVQMQQGEMLDLDRYEVSELGEAVADEPWHLQRASATFEVHVPMADMADMDGAPEGVMDLYGSGDTSEISLDLPMAAHGDLRHAF